MTMQNYLTCYFSCPLREDCKKIFDLHVEISNGICKNALEGRIEDFDAMHRALERVALMEGQPPILDDFCLLDEEMKKHA